MSSPSKIVLITGANSGVGYAAAKVIASASSDYHVIMAGRSSQKVNDAVAKVKEESGVKGSFSPLVLEVTDEDSISKAATEVKQQFGRLDVLINNAGIVSTHTNLKKKLEETFLVNSIGPFLVTEGFVDLLRQSKDPRVIYVTSGLGSITMASDPTGAYYGNPWMVYSMSKSALNMGMVAQSSSKELSGIKIWSVCPGLVRSNLRGTEEDQVNAGGRAGDPDVSGQTILGIVEGKRDGELGQFLHKDGTYGW